MAFVKKQLKTAREALESKNYEYCQGLCRDILENEENYTALVFLGLAELNLNDASASQVAYERAIKASPDIPLAYQGLAKLFDSTNNISGQLGVLSQLEKIYVDLYIYSDPGLTH